MKYLIIASCLLLMSCECVKKSGTKEKESEYQIECTSVGSDFRRCVNEEIICYKLKFVDTIECVKNDNAVETEFKSEFESEF